MKTSVDLKERIAEVSGAILPLLFVISTSNPILALASAAIGPGIKGLISGVHREKGKFGPRERMSMIIRKATKKAFNVG